jgi:hypothetical protein
VIDGEGNQGDMVGVDGADHSFCGRGCGGATMEFRGNAG